MRSISSALSLSLSLLLLGCGSISEESRREFTELEHAMTKLSTAPVDDWPGLLEEIRKQPLDDPAIREVRSQCIAAYEAYTTAATQLRDARRRVETVEAETRRLTDGDGGTSVPELGKLHRQASEATDVVGTSLDRAQQLVERCSKLRAELRERFQPS